MTLWERIGEALSALVAGEPLSAVLERLRSTPERSVAFTIAVIALGAKLAKADGQVTRAEVAAFRRIFAMPSEEEENAARVYNLARQDVAGFDAYARKVAAMFPAGDPVLADLLEALFHIALSDGVYHEGEDGYLARVAAIFGLEGRAFGMLKARFVEGAARDPWDVLGVAPADGIDAARKAWRRAVRENHPDALVARGLPREAVKLAEGRMADINAAWAEIEGRRAA
jgi:DnaJ like chaperone protein